MNNLPTLSLQLLLWTEPAPNTQGVFPVLPSLMGKTFLIIGTEVLTVLTDTEATVFVLTHTKLSDDKELPAMQQAWIPPLNREDRLEKDMATHSSILAWIVAWTEDSGGLQSMGL